MTLCVLDHWDYLDDGTRQTRERPTLAADGCRLCLGHDKNLHDNLTHLLELAVDLDAQIVKANVAGPRVTGNPETPMVGDLEAASHLRTIRNELVGWCRVVHEERTVDLPKADDLATLVRYLHRHHLWITDQPWIREYDTQIRDLHADGRRILAAARSRRVDLGPCEHRVSCDVETRDEQQCAGILRAVVLYGADSLPPVVCTACGMEHPSATWRTLGKRLRKGQDAWLTGAQLSEVLRVPWSTIRRWAVEDGWRSLDQRPRRYHADDAQRTYDQRPRTALDAREVRGA